MYSILFSKNVYDDQFLSKTVRPRAMCTVGEWQSSFSKIFFQNIQQIGSKVFTSIKIKQQLSILCKTLAILTY